jgi:hypothetical protein
MEQWRHQTGEAVNDPYSGLIIIFFCYQQKQNTTAGSEL